MPSFAEIGAVFKSAGTSTAGFFEHGDRFEAAMIAAGIQKPNANRVALEVEAIGKQARGPEDVPIR